MLCDGNNHFLGITTIPAIMLTVSGIFRAFMHFFSQSGRKVSLSTFKRQQAAIWEIPTSTKSEYLTGKVQSLPTTTRARRISEGHLPPLQPSPPGDSIAMRQDGRDSFILCENNPDFSI